MSTSPLPWAPAAAASPPMGPPPEPPARRKHQVRSRAQLTFPPADHAPLRLHPYYYVLYGALVAGLISVGIHANYTSRPPPPAPEKAPGPLNRSLHAVEKQISMLATVRPGMPRPLKRSLHAVAKPFSVVATMRPNPAVVYVSTAAACAVLGAPVLATPVVHAARRGLAKALLTTSSASTRVVAPTVARAAVRRRGILTAVGVAGVRASRAVRWITKALKGVPPPPPSVASSVASSVRTIARPAARLHVTERVLGKRRIPLLNVDYSLPGGAAGAFSVRLRPLVGAFTLIAGLVA